jgi:hypothetical protein
MTASEIVQGHEDRYGRASKRKQFEEPGKVVNDEAAAERDAPRDPHHEGARYDQENNRRDVNADRPPAGGEDTGHEQQHGATGQNKLRQRGQDCRNFGALHCYLPSNPAACTAPSPWL